MIAEVLAGNADGALDYYLRINPSAREAISEIHRCEPYVYAQMIAGRDAPTHGEAKNSWLSGTAAWNYVAAIAVDRREFGPSSTASGSTHACPAGWGEIRVARRFRGATYRIVVHPPGSAAAGAADRRPACSSTGGRSTATSPHCRRRPASIIVVEAFLEVPAEARP